MKNNIKYLLPIILLGLFIIIPCCDIMAACSFPGGCCPSTLPPQFCPGGCGPCVPVPLDGGLSALVLAGVAYGAKRVYGKSKV